MADLLNSRGESSLDPAKILGSLASGEGVSRAWKKLVVPVFTQATSWAGVSTIALEFPIGNTKNISIKLPIKAPSGVDYCLAVRDGTSGNNVNRYKLWENVGEVLAKPLYSGETLGIGATLEVWTISAGVSVNQATVLNLFIGDSLAPVRCETSGALQTTNLLSLVGVIPYTESYANPYIEIPFDLFE